MNKMARRTIGNVCKNKDPAKANYIQIRKDLKEPITLSAGQFLSVESKRFQLESLEKAEADGKIGAENANKARDRIEKIADWVLGEVILTTQD